MIRDAVPADAEAIARAHVAAWRTAYRGIVPDALLDRLSVAARYERAREALAAPGPGRTFVAELDGEVAGWCRTGPARDDDPPGETELWALYVSPDAWGRGTGAALLREAGAEGATYLWTLEANDRARRFYERHGWVCDGTRRERDLSVAVGGAELVLAEIRYLLPRTTA